MFHYDRGLKLTRADLAIDFRRRQPRAFVSHAHVDHMARHEYALCTPDTAALYRLRFGPRATRELPYGEPLEWGGLRLTTFPAGHCLGSAMLLAEDGDRSLLYTGDFKLGESATAVRAQLPRAEVLVIECTYGRPLYRHPPREQAIDELLTRVREALDRGATPVIEAYVLGKSQEVTRLLTGAGFPVLQHPKIHDVSQVYRDCGVDLGDCHRYAGMPLPGHVVIVPPRTHRHGRLPGLRKTVTFAVTGWAVHSATRERLGVDHAIPLSDHADYDELFEAVERVSPRIVYCTHGPESFVDCLRAAGHNAHPLNRPQRDELALAPVQKRLF
ncbi:MAG: MBL fold metallo-hydrolase [Pirellulales bacterium]